MIFRNSLSITTNKFTLIYKVLLYIIIISLIFSAIAVAFLLPTLKMLFSEISDIHIIKNIGEYLNKLVNGEAGNADWADVRMLLDKIGDIIAENTNRLILAGVFGVILYFIFMFLTSVCYYSVSDIVNSFMNSASSYPFMSNFVHNFKKSARFALLFTLINIPIHIILALIIVGITVLCSYANYLFAAVMCLLISLIAAAFSHVLFSAWIPAMVVGNEGIVQALKTNFKKKRSFLYMFGVFFAYRLFMFVIMILVSLLTLGIGGIFLMSASVIMVKTMDLVMYYHDNGLKYYKDRNTVINPTHRFAESVYDAAIQKDIDEDNKRNNNE